MIESHDGRHCVCIDTESDWNCWVFQKHPDGQWVSLRMALPSEVKSAQYQLARLEMVADIPVRG